MQKIVLSNGSFDLGAGQFNKNFKIKTDEATCAGDSISHATNMPISHHRRVRRIAGSVSIKATFAERA